jgi:hypothetical protein|tara:strand:- start:387 stop:932 length:546 start_codon:yes stop_codon:yes gene_type:complete
MSEETKNQSEEVKADSPETEAEMQENNNEQVRTPRSVESREIDSRPMSWDNIGNLPEPDPQDGWVFRWVRTALLGQTDNPNVSRRMREGWQPVRLEDHPELQIHMMDHNSEWAKKGHVEIGGQLLCKMSKERAAARDKHFADLASSQVESVDNTYFKDQDNRMATKQVFERKSRTTFGKDS